MKKSVIKAGMHLSRISMVNWYGFSKIDMEVRGNIALIGRNGAGKSSIIDAIQLVLTGGNSRFFETNAASENSKRTKKNERRTIREYCLGTVDGETLREESITYLSLVFKSVIPEDPTVITVGVAYSARLQDDSETLLGYFIVDGHDLSTDDYVSNGMTKTFQEFETYIRHMTSKDKAHFPRKVGDYCNRMFTMLSKSPNFDRDAYLKALKNSLAFREMDSATDFVREFILPVPEFSKQKSENLKAEYAIWKDIQSRIAKISRQKEQIFEIGDRHEKLVERQKEMSFWSMIEVLAGREQASEAQQNAQAAIEKADADFALASQQQARTRSDISETEKAITLSQAELGAQDVQAKLKAAHDNLGRVVSDNEKQMQRRSRIMSRLAAAGSLRPLLREAADIVDCGDAYRAVINFSDALIKEVSVEKSIPGMVDALGNLQSRLEAAEAPLWEKFSNLKRQAEEDHKLLKQFQATGKLISDKVSSLITLLKQNGIEAEPLCSLVEVREERWRLAAETLLGNAREALIVDPNDVSDAIRVLDESGNRFTGCLIYDAKHSDRSSPNAAPGTLASKLKVENPYARAFLNIRIGGFQCVDHRDDLRNFNRAVTDNVMVKSGGAISRSHTPRDMILGLTAITGSAEEIGNRIHKAEVERSSARSNIDLLRKISASIDDFKNTANEVSDLQAIEQAIVDLDISREKFSAEIASLEKMLSSEKFEHLRELEADLKDLLDQLSEDDKNLSEAATARGRANARLETAMSALASSEERVATRKAFVGMPVYEEAELKLPELMKDHGSAQTLIKEARREVEAGGARINQRLQAVRQDAANYAREFEIEFDAGDTADSLATWIKAQIVAIEDHVLPKYRLAAENARKTMEATIYNDFILRLSNDLSKGKKQINELNKGLGNHVFNGEQFSFTYKENKAYADIIALSTAIVASERSMSDLFDPAPESPETLSDKEERGIRKIRDIFENGGNLEEFTDYRNYMTFDLIATKAKTGKEIAGADVIGKRSGGERQVPFYISMASAIASICYRYRKDGMGFAIFDEAFTKMDGGNVHSSVSMMCQLGIQLFMSAPTTSAAGYISNVDTVINMSRHHTRCQIDVEYPTDYAREMLVKKNPAISGLAALEEV